MRINELKVFLLQIIMIVFLVLALFVSNITFGEKTLAIIIGLYSLIVYFFIKKRKPISLYAKEVLIVLIAFAALYLILYYLIGVYISFAKSIYPLKWINVKNHIIPITIIILSSELIRNKFITQEYYIHIFNKRIDVSKILTFILMVLLDLLLYAKAYNLNKQDEFLEAFAYILFASISTNLLFNYLTIRFGSKGVISYRLITVLYIYFIPIVPKVYLFFKCFARMIYPYLIYIYMENTYAKASLKTQYKDKTKNIIFTTVTIVFSIILIMLISCEFTYGLIVIGTGSMTGTINIGDAIVFKKYTDQELDVGDIIMFRDDNKDVVHRIVDIKSIDGEKRYYTKGDYNKDNDFGYRVEEKINGIYLFRIPSIGYPNLWFRQLFN